jgi:DNA-binding NtrC family response regulator
MWQTDVTAAGKYRGMTVRTLASVPGRLASVVEDDVLLAAAVDVPVLVTARAAEQRIRYARLIHENGPRSTGPFVAAVSTEADGHGDGLERKYEEARGGTLFVDDLAAMPAQARHCLVSLLERRTSPPVESSHRDDVRIVAGASVPLASACPHDAGFARLFYRLNIIHIHPTESTPANR